MAQQGSILLPTIAQDVYGQRFTDNFLTPALSSIDVLYSVSEKSFYYKAVGDTQATTVKIDFQGLNNAIVTKAADNKIILTTL